MARAVLTPVVLVRTGLATTAGIFTAAVADGHSVVNDGVTTIVLVNTNAAARTVTVVTPGTVDGNEIADVTITVPATTGRMFAGPFPKSVYSQADGTFHVNYSATAGLTVAAIRIPREVLP